MRITEIASAPARICQAPCGFPVRHPISMNDFFAFSGEPFMRLQPKHLNFSVACLALLALPAAQALPMQDVGTSAGPQCVGLDINNSGHVVGACAESDGSSAGFVSLAPGSAADLARLSPGRDRKSTRLNSSHSQIS